MKFATQIKRWRLARKLSQSQAAKTLGLKKRTIQNWEQGVAEPSAPTLAAFGNRFAAK